MWRNTKQISIFVVLNFLYALIHDLQRIWVICELANNGLADVIWKYALFNNNNRIFLSHCLQLLHNQNIT